MILIFFIILDENNENKSQKPLTNQNLNDNMRLSDNENKTIKINKRGKGELNMINLICKSDEFTLLKRLDNGSYMNLTDLDFSSAKNINNELYELPPQITSEYCLMFMPVKLDRNFYIPITLDRLIVYAPSIKKIKKISIADVIIAKLMNENTSLRFTLTDNEDKTYNIETFLLIGKNDGEYKVKEQVQIFENVISESLCDLCDRI